LRKRDVAGEVVTEDQGFILNEVAAVEIPGNVAVCRDEVGSVGVIIEIWVGGWSGGETNRLNRGACVARSEEGALDSRVCRVDNEVERCGLVVELCDSAAGCGEQNASGGEGSHVC